VLDDVVVVTASRVTAPTHGAGVAGRPVRATDVEQLPYPDGPSLAAPALLAGRAPRRRAISVLQSADSGFSSTSLMRLLCNLARPPTMAEPGGAGADAGPADAHLLISSAVRRPSHSRARPRHHGPDARAASAPPASGARCASPSALDSPEPVPKSAVFKIRTRRHPNRVLREQRRIPRGVTRVDSTRVRTGHRLEHFVSVRHSTSPRRHHRARRCADSSPSLHPSPEDNGRRRSSPRAFGRGLHAPRDSHRGKEERPRRPKVPGPSATGARHHCAISTTRSARRKEAEVRVEADRTTALERTRRSEPVRSPAATTWMPSFQRERLRSAS
jgi:hypothetical protein